VPRTAFQNEYFSGIDGLIWSQRSTGNFLGNTDEVVYVQPLSSRPPPDLLVRLIT
jgi:hypothetical protein